MTDPTTGPTTGPAGDLAADLVLPAGLHPLPLALDADGLPDADAFERFVDALVPRAGDGLRLDLAVRVLRFLRDLGADVEFAAVGVLDDERGGRAPLTLSVTRRPAHHGDSAQDAEAAAQGLVEVLGRTAPAGRRDVRRVDLPCGPAALEVAFERRSFGTPEDGPFLDLGRLDVHVPAPGTVVTLSFGTSALHVWDDVSALAAAVAASLRTGAAARG